LRSAVIGKASTLGFLARLSQAGPWNAERAYWLANVRSFFGTGEVIEFVVDVEQALTFDFDDGAWIPIQSAQWPVA
jgi:hypothetical protein